MAGYQHLQKYRGSLYGNADYDGIEYDFEVPDDEVIASPGGVSGIHHHYTHGMYSDAVNNQDIHAGEGYAYPYGELGNMYQQGQSATRYMGDFVDPPDVMYTENQTQPRKENFKNGMEIVPPPDDQPLGSTPVPGTTPVPGMADLSPSGGKNISTENFVKLMTVFAAGYMAINFWTKGGEEYIVKKFYGNKNLNWKQYMIIAAFITAGLVAFSYFFGVPLVTLEKI